MTLDLALRLTQIGLGLAYIQRSLEHLKTSEPIPFVARIVACALLVAGVAPGAMLLALALSDLWLLRRYGGPYNGGADKMGLLMLIALALAQFAPTPKLRALSLGYLAAQVVLSYFLSGWVKVVNPDWRAGVALRDVFLFSAYPAGENLRVLAEYPRLLKAASWAVIAFELAFPLALASAPTLWGALALGATFHLANACLFGLNRFFWIWLAAYPALLWFQTRLV